MNSAFWRYERDPVKRKTMYKIWWRKTNAKSNKQTRRIKRLTKQGRCLKCEILLAEVNPNHDCTTISFLGVSDVTEAGAVEIVLVSHNFF